ncbi:choline binding protein F, partial [Streptococcus pneumoniae 357]
RCETVAELGNKWYYLRSSGAMATGWYQEGSTWYYLNASNGDMKTGWFQVNGNWYYAYDSGALAVNTTVGGYYLNYNGEWVK